MLARNRYEVAAEVRRLISETLAVPLGDVNEATRIVEELHATSMDIVTLAMTLDDFFEIDFDLSTLPNSNVDVSWIVDYIYERADSK